MRAYILAAGYATRLYPLTRDRPKALLEVADRPILDHILERVLELEDLREVVVIANHRFAPDFERWAAASPVARGSVPVSVLDDGSTCEGDRLGAIGDLDFALRRVPPRAESFAVIAGDNLLRGDLRPLQAEMERRRRTTLALRPLERGSGASRYNEVTLADNGRVVRFREKPADPQTGLAALALYLFPAEVAALVSRYLAQGGKRDAPGHFIAWLVERAPVGALPFAGEWFDIGSPETLAGARRALAERRNPRV